MEQFLIGANWKMNKGPQETRQFFSDLKEQLGALRAAIEVLICPPSISLTTAQKNAKNGDIKIGAQNVYYEDNGAYTGEISTQMLGEIDCSHVIVGHSERRQYFGETNAVVNTKALRVLSKGMQPIICVGESLKQRKNNIHKKMVRKQLKAALQHVESEDAGRVIFAYEPLWAIGTGESASPEQAQEMHAMIRKEAADFFDEQTARQIPILYGGSMKPDNAQSLLKQTDINGGLIGGASLKANSFAAIIDIAEKLSKK